MTKEITFTVSDDIHEAISEIVARDDYHLIWTTWSELPHHIERLHSSDADMHVVIRQLAGETKAAIKLHPPV